MKLKQWNHIIWSTKMHHFLQQQLWLLHSLWSFLMVNVCELFRKLAFHITLYPMVDFFFHSNRIVWPGRICINAEYIPRNACICINEELTTIEMKNEYLLLMARTIDFWTNMQAWWILHGQTNEMLQKRIDCLLFIRYARWSLTKNDNWQYNNKYIKIVKIQQVRRFGIHAWIDHIFRFCFAQKKYSNFNNNTNIYIFYCYYC